MINFKSRAAVAGRGAVGQAAKVETRNPAELSSRVLAFATVVIAVAAVSLRVWQLGLLGFNSDEAVYAGQAASIVGHPDYRPIFPIFRAHPLLYQFSLALVYQFVLTDLAGRILAVGFGLAGLWFVHRAGNLLYGRRVGVVAALLLAVMPYHVVVTRQALLDGPMTTFAALTLYLVARYAVTEQPRWLYAAGAGLGLTFLAKETAVVFLPAIYAFLALSPSIRVKLRDLAISAGCFALVIAPFPLSLLLGGGTKAGKGFLAWQLFRPPNHSGGFYLQYVPVAVGFLVVLAAAAALFLLRREWTWRENLLVLWIATPVLFFQAWPVKGFQYLLPTAPAIVILAARALAGWPTATPLRLRGRRVSAAALQVTAVTLVAASLAASSWSRVNVSNSTSFLAGSGGVPGGRAAGLWLRDNVPAGAQMLALGPSMANILQFYSHQRVYGLSVSPNPLHRNPAYDPVPNPDRLLRDGRLQYLIWDSYSAARSKFFADNLLRYVSRYRATEVHRETVSVRNAAGVLVQEPVIIIYRVRRQ
jgi:4-amino-4-deoxy-L-arabinose transferase-like glycosyltransferase